MGFTELLVLLIAAVLISLVLLRFARRVTIYEFEKGLLYKGGRFARLLDAGQYWYMPFFSSVMKVDVRPRFVSITGQEVLSSDGVSIKVSVAANYEIADANTAINKVQSFYDTAYIELQMALREILGQKTIDEIMEGRAEISKSLMDITSKKLEAIGIKLLSAELKDIMFPGALKQVFAQVVNARKEGLAALERARGESAALRNLANAAKMLESNPALLQLRMLQALGESSGNTLVLGVPPGATVLPVGKESVGEGESGEATTKE